MQFYGISVMHPYKQYDRCQDVFIKHILTVPDVPVILFQRIYDQL
jgi:hypothetical protein